MGTGENEVWSGHGRSGMGTDLTWRVWLGMELRCFWRRARVWGWRWPQAVLSPPPSCFHSGFTVHLGKHALGRVEAGEQARDVVRHIRHPQYQSSPTHLNHDHDIMLLELRSPVWPTSHVRVLPLSSRDCLPAGTACRVSGWGTTTSPQGTQPRRGPRSLRVRTPSGGRRGGCRVPAYVKMDLCLCDIVHIMQCILCININL